MWLRKRGQLPAFCFARRFMVEDLTGCAVIRICVLRRPGLSADDRRIAVQNTAFDTFLMPAGSL
jgi:hypothetical protein